MVAATAAARSRARTRQSAEEVTSVVLQHSELVERIAYQMIRRMPASVEVADLIQAGMIGLLEAQRRYSIDGGASFETYASNRIRGAMMDELRRLDWVPRSLRHQLRGFSRASRQLAMESGRPPRESEIAMRLGSTIEEISEIRMHAERARFDSIEGHLEQIGSESDRAALDGEFRAVARDAFLTALAGALETLPQRDRLVLSLYFDEGLNLRQIGEVLGVTESRVCQMRSRAVERLRQRLSDWLDGEGA